MEIQVASTKILPSGELQGEGVQIQVRSIQETKQIYRQPELAEEGMEAYHVHYESKEEGLEGGLQFGTSFIQAGKVGDEYIMTKGHFHEKKDRAEYYWCIRGEGILLLMDEERNCRAEKVESGSLHYISGNVAHRLVNTGEEELAVDACWPSDAGHDYGSIQEMGFSLRVMEINGETVLISE